MAASKNSMSAHTPGPWKADSSSTSNYSMEVTYQSAKGLRRVVARVASGADHREHDARLIAAAPALAEALRMAYDVHGYAPGRGPPWYQAARAALAEAGL